MRRLTLVVAAFLFAMLAPANAQTPDTPEFVSVVVVKVRPAAVAEFEDYVKKLNAAALKIGLKVRADVYQTAQGGSPFEYNIVSGYPSLEALGDTPTVPAMVMKAYGDAEGAKIMRAGRAAIESVEFVTLRHQVAWSTKPKAVVGSAFFQLVETEIDPAMEQQYIDYLTKAKTAGDKFTAAPTTFRHTYAFGSNFVHLAAQPFDTWAERAKWQGPAAPLVAAYGQAEADRLMDVVRRATKSRTIRVVAYRRDLSRIPPGTTTD